MAIEVIDPFTKIWKPARRRDLPHDVLSPQEEFLAIPFDVHEAFYGGAVGGGKSEILLVLPIYYQFYKNPKFQGIIFRKTYPQLEKSLILRSKEIYPLVGGRYNSQNHTWSFESGATITFGHMETKDEARRHDTNEYQYIGWDELTEFDEWPYIYMFSRNRSTIKGIPAIVRAASNPGNIGHGWVRGRFIEPAQQGRVPIYDARSKSYRIWIPAKLTDNPHLTEKDPNYINRLAALPAAEYKAKVEGDWWVYEGQVFTEFRDQRIPGEPSHALHVIEPFKIAPYLPKLGAIDWGWSAMTWAGRAAVFPDGKVIVYGEYAERKKYIREWASDLERTIQFEDNFKSWQLDPSAWGKRGESKTIAEQFIEVSSVPVEQADNDRLGGKLLVHEFLRWKPRPKKYIPPEGYDENTAQFILRNRGTEAYHEYGKVFTPDPPEKNLPKLQIFRTCTKLIKAIQLCVYEDDKDHKAEDVKEFDGDDPYDGLRYLLKKVDRYVNEARAKFEADVKIASIYEEFARTGDYTLLHRKLEHLERHSKKIVPFQRIHRGTVH